MATPFHSSEPGGRAPAPEPLRLVQLFVNTTDIEGARERLRSAEQLGRWLEERDLVVDRAPSEADLRRALELREAIRTLLLANNGLPADPAAVEVLNLIAERTQFAIRFHHDRVLLVPSAGGVYAALGHIVADVYRAMEQGTWPRLKACRRDACRWAFYDHSKNRSARWCAMEICGNRVKTRAYYSRQRARSRH